MKIGIQLELNFRRYKCLMRHPILVMSLSGAIPLSMQALATSILLSLLSSNVGAAIRFVNHANPSPAPPYVDWASAATNIQDAIDAAGVGDQILVTNGVYRFGGRTAESVQSNRVALSKEIVVSSVNGPAVTFIEGTLGPDSVVDYKLAWGSNSVRCAYVGSNAVLSGFTLTNGHTIYGGFGGGVLSESRGVVSNCVIVGNKAFRGGGGYGGTFQSCVFSTNVAGWGGGVFGATVHTCFIAENWAGEVGGGAMDSTLYHCTVVKNFADELGGGVLNCRVFNSIVYHNLWYNETWSSLENSCSSPLPPGPGNIAADPQIVSGFQISSGSACKGAGSTNYLFGRDLEGEPWRNPPSMGCDEPYPLSVAFGISYTNVTPGFSVYLTTMLDGEVEYSVWDFGDGTRMTNTPYASHVWMLPGDYEVVLTAYNVGKVHGVSARATVRVTDQSIYYVSRISTNATRPYASWETAATNIQDAVDAAVIGATVLVTNGIYDTGGKVVWGLLTNRLVVDKPVKVQSVNGPDATVIKGYQVPDTIRGDEAIRGVYMVPGSALVGFTVSHGATREYGMGDAVSEQSGGGVLCESVGASVSNCVLILNSAGTAGGGIHGGTLNNCIISNNSAMHLGGGVCAATVTNCTITRNFAKDYGGGAQYSALFNCVLLDNTAETAGGGGAQLCNLYNCLVARNSAAEGGGAQYGGLFNCTVTANSSSNGGGVALSGPVFNCIIYDNVATNDGANHFGSDVTFSCTVPLPDGRMSNITNAPMFVAPGVGDFRLQSNSPCINSGGNDWASGDQDLDGNARVAGGSVDMGAYEFRNPSSIMSYAWLQRYGFPNDGSADRIDTDSDGVENWQEWRSGTDCTNALSVLKMLAPSNTVFGMMVSWQSVDTRLYYLERSTNLQGNGFVTVESNIVGQAEITTRTDLNASNPSFYRVGVH